MAAPLLIADTPWLLYRSFFALPKSIADQAGRPVNALLGTVNALLTATEATKPRAVVACFGSEEARYRVELYPPYHAHREPMPDELAAQWRRAPGLLESFGWIVFDAGELEADDAMSSFAAAEREVGGEALLLTGDRDLYQAVDEDVAVLELVKGGGVNALGPAQVEERYGIAPSQVVDLIALRGDPSDGLPGAPGVGAKTAAALLTEHGSLEKALDAARHAGGAGSGMSMKVASSLRENAELLLDFKQIATLHQIEVQRPADRPTDFAAGAKAAAAHGMKRLAERLKRQGSRATPGPPGPSEDGAA
jgi:DNA polymerase-1